MFPFRTPLFAPRRLFSDLPAPMLFAIAAGIAAVGDAAANPDIKDGAIKVLLNFKTSCSQQAITREDTAGNALKFTIECSDKIYYPDGLVVVCPERDVEASCEIKTSPREFKYLNLIYGPMGERVGGFEDHDDDK